MHRWYFAYGSNLLRAQFYARTGPAPADAPAPQRGLLAHYQIAFTMHAEDGCHYANITPHGDGVPGVLYPCTEETLRHLDAFEHGYIRLEVTITTDDQEQHRATTYIAPPSAPGPPTTAYLNKILSGAQEHGLPARHIAFLESTRCSTQ